MTKPMTVEYQMKLLGWICIIVQFAFLTIAISFVMRPSSVGGSFDEIKTLRFFK